MSSATNPNSNTGLNLQRASSRRVSFFNDDVEERNVDQPAGFGQRGAVTEPLHLELRIVDRRDTALEMNRVSLLNGANLAKELVKSKL